MFPLRDDVPSRGRPFVGWLLIALNVWAFIQEVSMGRGLEKFIHTWGLVPARYSHYYVSSQTWPELAAPFFTSMFLHGGLMHLISNMWMLYIFGNNVEDKLGHGRFFLFYLLCGLAAGAAQTFSALNSVLPMVGASGAIAGVMGAYLILFPTARILTLVPIFIFARFVEIPASIYLGYWLLMQFLSTRHMAAGAASGVAWWAHIGGFIAGLVLLGLFLPRRRRR